MIKSRRVIMHPCDRERAYTVAALLEAEVTLSENWLADRIGLDGDITSDDLELVTQTIPGWRVSVRSWL